MQDPSRINCSVPTTLVVIVETVEDRQLKICTPHYLSLLPSPSTTVSCVVSQVLARSLVVCVQRNIQTYHTSSTTIQLLSSSPFVRLPSNLQISIAIHYLSSAAIHSHLIIVAGIPHPTPIPSLPFTRGHHHSSGTTSRYLYQVGGTRLYYA